jgi:hypothetical protein
MAAYQGIRGPDLYQRTGITGGDAKEHGPHVECLIQRRSPVGPRAYAFFKNLQLALS